LQLTSERSLVQQAYDRASKIGDKVYVLTEGSHADALRAQLPELPDDAFMVEPGRRNTASCVIMALVHIQARHDNDEPIAFMSADHSIRDVNGFIESFRRAKELSRAEATEVLVGIEPSYPSTGFGYIEKGDCLDAGCRAYQVSNFKEKPDFKTAKGFIQSGKYLWNAGYFVGSVNVFLDKMRTYAPDLYRQYQDLSEASPETYDEVYLGFQSVAIDVALNEKVADLLVVPASFDWMDIGSFTDLHDVLSKDEVSNYFHGENIHDQEVENAYIRNEEDKPIAVIGLDNIVVVNTPNGLLVARKDLAAKVGDIAKKVQE
jgi:mannose-1-phosphate guanylyltransferase